MFGLLKGTGVVDSITKLGMELIETDKESAEAKAILYKSIDPNGKMRRDISSRVTSMYSVYIGLTMVLVLASAFDVGDPKQVQAAVTNLTDLFTPITAMFGAIVGASFGTNVSNNWKDKNSN
jgi:hypothetical protein